VFQGSYDEAEGLVSWATEIWEKALGPEHPSVGKALNNRATVLIAVREENPCCSSCGVLWTDAIVLPYRSNWPCMMMSV